jgi:O-succinylbenzoate synthase
MKRELFRYALPIDTPLLKREGLVVKLTNPDGMVGWGEVAPLPGFSRETLEEVRTQFSPHFSSVCFGMQSALNALNHPHHAFSLPLSALFMGNKAQILARATLAKQEGFTTAKVKLSKLSFEEAYAVVETLRNQFALRIDVNRAWSFEDAMQFFSRFPPNSFEYVEEPTYEIGKLTNFPFPFALDESLKELNLFNFPHLKAMVLKPTLLGDISPFVTRAKQQGLKVILSSFFESGLGLAHIACLAHRLGLHSDPIGLDTYRYFKQDLLTEPLRISDGRIHIPASLEINTALLSKE